MTSTTQKPTRLRRSAAALATLGAGAALVMGSAAAADAASWEPYTWERPDDGGVGEGAGIYKVGHKQDFYEVLFVSRGETLTVTDSTPDDKQAKAYLRVEGSGTATFTNHYQEDYSLSFDEGKDVQVKVCIEGTSTCSGWSAVGTT